MRNDTRKGIDFPLSLCSEECHIQWNLCFLHQKHTHIHTTHTHTHTQTLCLSVPLTLTLAACFSSCLSLSLSLFLSHFVLWRKLLCDSPMLVSSGPWAWGLSWLSNTAQSSRPLSLLSHQGRGRRVLTIVYTWTFDGGWCFAGGVFIVVPIVPDIWKQSVLFFLFIHHTDAKQAEKSAASMAFRCSADWHSKTLEERQKNSFNREEMSPSKHRFLFYVLPQNILC